VATFGTPNFKAIDRRMQREDEILEKDGYIYIACKCNHNVM